MLAKSLLVASCFGAFACSAARGEGVAVEAVGATPSIFDLAASSVPPLPDLAPDDLLVVKNPLSTGDVASLRAGKVLGAWTAVPDASGQPPVLVFQCRPNPAQPGANDPGAGPLGRTFVWVVVPDAALAPIGVEPAALAAALPYSARHERVEAGGIYLVAPHGPAWTITGQVGTGASARQVRTQLIGAIDDLDPGPNPGSMPLYRYRQTGSSASERLDVPTIDHAIYVLRLNTVGGVGPDDEGAPCDPGSLDESVEFAADFYFVEMPWSYLP